MAGADGSLPRAVRYPFRESQPHTCPCGQSVAGDTLVLVTHRGEVVCLHPRCGEDFAEELTAARRELYGHTGRRRAAGR